MFFGPVIPYFSAEIIEIIIYINSFSHPSKIFKLDNHFSGLRRLLLSEWNNSSCTKSLLHSECFHMIPNISLESFWGYAAVCSFCLQTLLFMVTAIIVLLCYIGIVFSFILFKNRTKVQMSLLSRKYLLPQCIHRPPQSVYIPFSTRYYVCHHFSYT